MKIVIILLIASLLISWQPVIGGEIDKDVLAKIAVLDTSSGTPDTIDPGIETEALVRYVNDSILRKYDKDLDGKVEGDEAIRFANDRLGSVSESELKRVYGDAYRETADRFAGGIPISDSRTIQNKVPFVPRTQGFSFGVTYGQKNEATQDIESIGSSLEYKWGGGSLVSVPFTFGTKLTYGKENTFVGDDASKVERWTLQPVNVTVGTDDWFARPVIGLGYGRSRTETIENGLVVGDSDRDSEFVWELGLDFPIRLTDKSGTHHKVASLSILSKSRFEKIASDKRNNEVGLQFSIGTKEFKTLRRIIKD